MKKLKISKKLKRKLDESSKSIDRGDKVYTLEEIERQIKHLVVKKPARKTSEFKSSLDKKS
jgi:hypothetical protein